MKICLSFALFCGLVACGTHLTATTTQKVVSIRRSAEFQLQDCSGDGGACKPSQVRALAASIDCAAASVLSDGKQPVDAGPNCPKVAP